MSAFKKAPVTGGAPRQNKLATLHSATMIKTKPVLPAEIISTILDYLPVSDLFRFARTSRRMCEMVYDDTRWVQRLQSMGCWNENEARQRFEDARRKKWESQKASHEEEAKRIGIGVGGINGNQGEGKASITLFDTGLEQQRQRRLTTLERTPHSSHPDGFSAVTISPSEQRVNDTFTTPSARDPGVMLKILTRVQSVRGHARQEYGRIYGVLGPFYFDLARSKSHSDPVIFRAYRDPEQQAQMLAQLKVFAKSDMAQGWQQREEKLDAIIAIFENAVLREFEKGYEDGDVQGRMKKYANVLVTLNGGQAGIELFVQKTPIISERAKLGNPMNCLKEASSGNISLEPSHNFFSNLSSALNEQTHVIEQIFPDSTNVVIPLLERLGEDVIAEYVTPLFDEAHQRDIESYLKAVSGLYEQSLRFARSLELGTTHREDALYQLREVLAKVFEPHVDLYLQEELEFFNKRSDAEVRSWETKLSEQDASTESYFMSNVNRQADKRDFLTSFRKVVMMPVNVLPSIPISSPFASSKPAVTQATVANGSIDTSLNGPLQPPSRSSTPASLGRSSTPLPEAPTTELAAKTAIMNSKLEGIRSLFSIEVALNLVHAAKSSLERAALFVRLGGQSGEEAREQCETIFVLLLQTLGSRHIKPGFDKAVDHLSNYNPREASEPSQPGVTPLVMFLELVNVGDLIQQMVDVFYAQELVATKLTDLDDFLDPAVKEKKRFEQMLDERVAAGLNKGIDVLIAEVEYICATTQIATDFNPGASGDANGQVIDISPSTTALRIVDVVSSHTKMLVGSTDKNMLDVFNQEVGLRLFSALCKHLKRQRISVDGAIKLISDMNHYFTYIQTLKNADLLQYFKALRELSQIYLIDPSHAKEMATIIADADRFYGIFRAEEVYEFAERRADWYQVRKGVERAMYGIGCVVM
ncbi:MAG: F-box protein: endocytic membrane traffic, recycling ReCYcling 1 [Candelina submexicana]|nr:MAG: F-box protein: endocytic membrane traffic, recycling ReCYcling 1 [Candelina submexicana]